MKLTGPNSEAGSEPSVSESNPLDIEKVERNVLQHPLSRFTASPARSGALLAFVDPICHEWRPSALSLCRSTGDSGEGLLRQRYS